MAHTIHYVISMDGKSLGKRGEGQKFNSLCCPEPDTLTTAYLYKQQFLRNSSQTIRGSRGGEISMPGGGGGSQPQQGGSGGGGGGAGAAGGRSGMVQFERVDFSAGNNGDNKKNKNKGK